MRTIHDICTWLANLLYAATVVTLGAVITAKANGFQAQSNLIVDPIIGRQVNFTLTPGNASTTVTIEANGRNPIFL